MATENTEDKPTTDYAPGATGAAGTGTQQSAEQPKSEEKPAELKDEQPAEKPASAETKDEEPSAKTADVMAEILAELKAIHVALDNRPASCDSAEKPEEKPAEKPAATKDSAVVEDTTDHGISIEDFMADMRR